jgi:outer membrane protein
MSKLISTILVTFTGLGLIKADTLPSSTASPLAMRSNASVHLRAENEDGLHFTLKQAEAYALQNHPQIAAAASNADAIRQEIREARSAFFPQIYGESDSVYARDGESRLAASEGLSNSTVFSRQSDGVVLSQLITDFGRTYELTESAHFRASAASDRTNVARAIVVLSVDRSYLDVLRSNAVLRVADETVKARDLAFRQVSALAKTGLKSTLDVNFAQVTLSQAQLLLIQSKSFLDQAEAQLSTALGFADAQHFILTEEPLDEHLPVSPNGLIQEAMNQRPELANLRNELEASQRFAKAQDASKYPKITAMAAGGVNPIANHADFQNTYYMAGVNVEIPITTGGNLQAQAKEAHLFARAATDNLIDAQNTIGRDVRVAWLDTKTAHEQIAVTVQMVQAANQAQRLAQTRYKLGTSSIVEFTQAQLNYTQAELQETSARYDYQNGRALLNFATGSSFLSLNR